MIIVFKTKTVKSGAANFSPGDYSFLRADLSNVLYQDLIYTEIAIKSPKKSLEGNWNIKGFGKSM